LLGQLDSIGERRMIRKVALAALFLVLAPIAALAADFNGKWTAQFDTQVGQQKYTYEFHVDGTKLTGKAINEQFGSTDIQDGKIDGDNITFTEALNFNGNAITITYTGKIDGDEIKFTRKVGDFATEQVVAKRAK
jgi:hypothetical protein